jgi:hypothetical protein
MARKSRTLVSPGQGGCWKLLFRDPIQGHYADNPFINQTLLTILMPLDEETCFEAAATRDGVVSLYHIIKTDNGKTAPDLIASLQQPFVLGSTASSDPDDPDELDGPAMWEIGSEDEILTKAWMPLIMQQPPRNIAECERLAEISRRFCYLPIIFKDPTEVSSDARAFGTMISTEELRDVVEEREKWDTRVTITHHGDGTSHIVLDEEGMTLRQALAGVDGDIEMGRLCERTRGQGR